MKIFCNPEDLSNALNIVSKALPSRPSIPILEGIKMLVVGETITLSATDLDLFIETKIRARVLIEGEVVIPGRFLTDFIRTLKDLSEIEIESYDKKIKINYENNETEITGFDYESFPSPAEDDALSTFKIKERDFKDVIETTIFCVAVDETKPILKGCLLEVKEDELTAVALDGYRLAISKTQVMAAEERVSAIVPGKTLGEIAKILSESDEKITVSLHKNKIKFIIGKTIITTKLIEGNFIPYENIIPREAKAKITVNKNMLEKGLERVSLIARKRNNNYIQLDIEETSLKISSDADAMAIKEEITCKLEGENMLIAFNSKYLNDAFSKVKEDFINILFTGSNAPAIIVPTEGEAYKFIVLPVRLV